MDASSSRTLHYYFHKSKRDLTHHQGDGAGPSSSMKEPLSRRNDSEKEHDSDVIITNVEGPSCSTTGKH